ncbi:MAG: efflux RND transporter periplasmic adaptor subunit [Alphaproteobacteria bacterium]|nr:efflux RND transporter periplasmic adaptor subunit [Alphaproteobacteria bacterium]
MTMTAIGVRARATARHWLWPGLIALALVTGIAFVAWRLSLAPATGAAPAPEPPRVIELAAIEVSAVRRETLRQLIPLAGSIRPVNEALLRTEVAARVREVTVREGEAVKRGEVLVRLDTRDLKARLEERQRALDAAEAQLAHAERVRANTTALEARGYAARTSMDKADAESRALAANAGQIKAQIDMAQKALGEADLVAPIDGWIAERMIHPGEMAMNDTKLLTIVDLSLLEVMATVPASDIPRVAVGQTADFTVEGLGDRLFTGRVQRINPATLAGSRSIAVHIVLPNPDGMLRTGMFAAGHIVASEAADALALPIDAIRRDADGSHVLVIEAGHIRRRPVTLGTLTTLDGRVRIERGIQPGDVVVTAPLRLEPGMAARVGGQ